MSLTRNSSHNPGELLFDYLRLKCDSEHKCNVAISKIMAIEGGIYTVIQAKQCSQSLIDNHMEEINELEHALKEIKRKQNINSYWRYPAYTPLIGFDEQAKALNEKIKVVEQKYDQILSIDNLLTAARDRWGREHEKELEQVKAHERAAKEAEDKRYFSSLLEIVSNQMKRL